MKSSEFWLGLARGFPFFKATPTTMLFASVSLILFGFISTINAQSIPGHNRTDKVMTSVADTFDGSERQQSQLSVSAKPLQISEPLDGSLGEVADIFGVHLSSRVIGGELNEDGGEIVVPYEALFAEGSATPLKSTEALLHQIANLLAKSRSGEEALRLKLAVQARLHEDSAQAIRWVSALAAQISYYGIPMDRFSVALVDGPQDVVTFGFEASPAQVDTDAEENGS